MKEIISDEDVTIKKTVYIDKALDKKIKIQAVVEEKTESSTLNEILRNYYSEKEKMS